MTLALLESLPDPEIIDVLSYEEARQAAINKLVEIDPAYTALLESDPAIKVIEVAAYRELLLRVRVNEAAKSNLVMFSAGSDLEHLAGFYDVFRLIGETDEALRRRVIISISGRSTAGSRDWYRAAALRADVRVSDAAVYRVGTGPDIRVAVLAADNFGEPDAALLAAVDLVVQSDSVRVISDRIETVAATSVTANVVADIWLLPSAPQTVFTALEATLRAALAAEGGLGFNVTRSWLTAKLHQAGVHKVTVDSPAVDLTVDDNSAVKIGAVTLTYKGRDR